MSGPDQGDSQTGREAPVTAESSGRGRSISAGPHDKAPTMNILDTYWPRLPAEQSGRDQLKVNCCYCEERHVHGGGYGHRLSHCTDWQTSRRRKVDPRDTRVNNGYILCDPTEPGVNWDLERFVGRLIVLRNKHQRLTAEYTAMVPLDAHDRRVRGNLRAQADEIATVFARAGIAL